MLFIFIGCLQKRKQRFLVKTFAASASQAAARIGNANFEQANEIRRLIDANRAPELSEWQLNIQTRLDKSDNMLKEMHNMLATVIASNSSSAAPVVRPIVSGSAAAWAGVGPVTNDESPACAGDGPPACAGDDPPACAGDGLPAASASAATPAASTSTATPTSTGPPWPTADGLLANDALPGEFGLPVEMRERVVTFASSALPIYVHVPETIRKKIWADEFVDMSLLLPQQQERQQFALSIVNNGNENPIISVTSKAKQSIGNFQRWIKAFEIYMAIYMLQPARLCDAPKMLSYISTMRRLAEHGGNRLQYDESFRSLRTAQGWQWDVFHHELWLYAAYYACQAQSANMTPPAFRVKALGKADRNWVGTCFAFNRGRACRHPCKFRHVCKECKRNHPFIKCNKNSNPASASSAISVIGKK